MAVPGAVAFDAGATTLWKDSDVQNKFLKKCKPIQNEFLLVNNKSIGCFSQPSNVENIMMYYKSYREKDQAFTLDTRDGKCKKKKRLHGKEKGGHLQELSPTFTLSLLPERQDILVLEVPDITRKQGALGRMTESSPPPPSTYRNKKTMELNTYGTIFHCREGEKKTRQIYVR